MKLLNPFQNKDVQQQELVGKLLRIQEVEELAKKTNANLARSQEQFNSTLALNSQKWALEEQEHSERIKDMNKEVEALENRKKQALIPISVYKEEVDKTMAEAQGILKRAKEKEDQVDYLIEKLENKLTDVSDREHMVSKDEKILESKKRGISDQEEQLKKSIDLLTKEMLVFHEKQKTEESSLLKRKEEVALAEINFNAKLDKYKRDMEALKVWELELTEQFTYLEGLKKKETLEL